MQDPCDLVQDDPKAKMLLLLGEVGGLDEYDLIEAPDFRLERKVLAHLHMHGIFPYFSDLSVFFVS